MGTSKQAPQKGQAIVLIVLAMVVLLGFVALAVDGSMLYADRRFDQSVSDSASIAGVAAAAQAMDKKGITYSNWSCQSADMAAVSKSARTAAINIAQDNDITLDQDISDHNGVSVECQNVTVNGLKDKYLDVISQVTTETQTGFMKFIFGGTARNTTTAIGRVRPRSTLAHGYAIVALNPDDCKGMNTGAEFHGTADVVVDDGGVFTNGCLRGVGTQNVTVSNASIHYGGEYNNSGNSEFDPAPEKVDFQIRPEDYAIPEPNCNHADAHKLTGKNLRGVLEPGLYCVTGDATINAGDTLIGDGVTIVMVDGRLHINGKATVQLSAPSPVAYVEPAVPGVVIYAPPSTNYRDVNKNGILLNGNANSYFSGTILAPALDVYVTGTGSTHAYNAQIIGWNIQAGGTSATYVQFGINNLFQRPPSIELNR